MSTFGQWLAVQRKLKGLSQEAVSNLLQVSKQTISSWENNRNDAVISLHQYQLLLSTFGTIAGQEPQTGLVIRQRGQNRQQATWRKAKVSS